MNFAPSEHDIDRLEKFCREFALGTSPPDDLSGDEVMAAIKAFSNNHHPDDPYPYSIQKFLDHPWLSRISAGIKLKLKAAKKQGRPGVVDATFRDAWAKEIQSYDALLTRKLSTKNADVKKGEKGLDINIAQGRETSRSEANLVEKTSRNTETGSEGRVGKVTGVGDIATSTMSVEDTDGGSVRKGKEVAGKLDGEEVTGKSRGKEVAGKLDGEEVTGKSKGKEVAGKLKGKEVTAKPKGKEVVGKLKGKEVDTGNEAVKSPENGSMAEGPRGGDANNILKVKLENLELMIPDRSSGDLSGSQYDSNDSDDDDSDDSDPETKGHSSSFKSTNHRSKKPRKIRKKPIAKNPPVPFPKPCFYCTNKKVACVEKVGQQGACYGCAKSHTLCEYSNSAEQKAAREKNREEKKRQKAEQAAAKALEKAEKAADKKIRAPKKSKPKGDPSSSSVVTVKVPRSTVASVEKLVRALETQVQSMQVQLDEANQTLDSRLKQVEKIVDGLEGWIEETDDLLDTLDEKLAQFKKTLFEVEDNLQALDDNYLVFAGAWKIVREFQQEVENALNVSHRDRMWLKDQVLKARQGASEPAPDVSKFYKLKMLSVLEVVDRDIDAIDEHTKMKHPKPTGASTKYIKTPVTPRDSGKLVSVAVAVAEDANTAPKSVVESSTYGQSDAADTTSLSPNAHQPLPLAPPVSSVQTQVDAHRPLPLAPPASSVHTQVEPLPLSVQTQVDAVTSNPDVVIDAEPAPETPRAVAAPSVSTTTPAIEIDGPGLTNSRSLSSPLSSLPGSPNPEVEDCEDQPLVPIRQKLRSNSHQPSLHSRVTQTTKLVSKTPTNNLKRAAETQPPQVPERRSKRKKQG
ncbi:hypothetical protein CVT24_001930 [Panaeolus cyanescens]|uniref:Zn(2)-C6 fungal-type domain-containing protein n=1 Tax=Panaeolus cyanescens TaxID=181874 RepID=A0A409YHV9_9AGAR|nr:hypothetical protein CVT24_001930 [Panaeolus cyanescens]